MSPRNSNGKSSEKLTKALQNELHVLRFIHGKKTYSRAAMGKHLELSPASMSAIVNRLIEKGLVVEAGHVRSSLGRKPVSLAIRGDIAHIVGIDIGSFFLRVVITNMQGTILYRAQTETQISQGRKDVLERTFKLIYKAIQESGIAKESIKGIGLCHSGVIDSETGVVLSFPRPGQMAEWKNIPLRDMLEDEFQVPCLLEDSVRAIATAEKLFGLGTELSDFVYIDVGMGVGAGMFLDGKLYRGSGGNAGEFGHITIDEHGVLCSCGNTGCLETVASCAAIIQSVKKALEMGVDSKIREWVGEDMERVSIELIAQAAMENDSLAFRVLLEAASQIAIGLADLVNLLNPSVLIFGGALFRAAPQFLLDPMRNVIKQRSLEKSANEVVLKVSTLGSEAGALGAASLISWKILEDLWTKTIVQ
jgi:glucokinase-like ROK family protein